MNPTDTHTRHVHETAAMHDVPDQWHDHAHDSEKPQHGHAEVLNAGKIITTGLALFMLIVISVVAVYGFYTFYTTQKLTAAERASSIGPATDAMKFKYESIGTQDKGGKVEVLNAEGKAVAETHASLEAARKIARREYVGAN